MINWWMVFLGGGIGSLARLAMSRWLIQPAHSFPWATFWTNLLSCIIIGVLAGLRSKGVLQSTAQYLLMTGFCGGFSTFSTLSLETLGLLENGQLGMALLYVSLSMTLGVLLVFLSMKTVLAL